MAARISLTAVYEPVENGWTQARIKQLPGVITAAPTLGEAKTQLIDALSEYLLALQEGEPAPVPNGTAKEESLDLLIRPA